LCPTSAYSPEVFDGNKPTWILVKDGDFYEPIYVYETKKRVKNIEKEPHKSLVIHGLFQTKTSSDDKIDALLKSLQAEMRKQCRPKNSLPELYTFKRGLSSREMMRILTQVGYTVHLQVMNYQSKIVGFVVSIVPENTRFFVPCMPSPLLDEVDLILIDQVTDWKDYSRTVELLNALYVKTEGKIKCSPKMKIVDDGMVVGILTETEQYVKIAPNAPNTPDKLEEMEGVDYIEADKVVVGSVAPNNRRVRTIRNIHMESRFYRIFRTVVRELLSQYEKRIYKLQIVDMLENLTYSYSEKMAKLDEILRKVVGDAVEFKSMSEDMVDYLSVDTHFMNYTRCKKCEIRNVCKMGEDGHCHLYFPSKNLVMGMRNDQLYYTRLADELLRFYRIRAFMLEPMYYLNLTNVDYKINDNEILLLETFLKSENFSDLRLFNFSEYLREIPYDIAEV
jgi:hypothetical protein